ncbi:unnamed protein product [Schistocephalus solidus]|uniref:Amiloride-sensitive sodium channel n=1 Tax=Schistocephalus solidus TaxID=70667 RepID=A0A183TB06_SCHSO|nr:unnamed protein product [Schistocephalus solidus]
MTDSQLQHRFSVRNKCAQRMQEFKEHAFRFLESTSIRGCNRIVKSENRALRVLWTVYVCLTTLFLHISIMKLVNEYMEYSVNIQTYINMDAPTAFPAVTFCNHQPFSSSAYELWKRKKIMSPTTFNQMLRNRASKILEKAIKIPEGPLANIQLINASLIQEALVQGLIYDTLPIYYQSLNWPDHRRLGHKSKDVLVLCLLRYGSTWMLTGPGCADPMLKIRHQSDPKYFNCYSVEIMKYASEHINELGLILWLGPDKNYGKEDRQAFLFDLFEQSVGLRVVIHEPGQRGSLDRHGFQVAPGRMNEVIFQTVKMIHFNRPNKPCFANSSQRFNDLDEEYDYQFEMCLSSYIQNLVVQRCGCLYAYFPRIYPPNATLPYCGQLVAGEDVLLDEDLIMRRRQCARLIISNAAVLRKKIEEEKICLRRCVVTEYETQVSVTMWRPTSWQLYWSQKTSSLFDSAINGSLTPDEAHLIYHFLKTKNLTNFSADESNEKNTFVFDDRFAYLVVKRKSNDTVVKNENLVLTQNALFSRIGGLCSLYIGMTFAFFVEIVEFIYMTCKRNFGKKSPREIVCVAERGNFDVIPNRKYVDMRTDEPLVENTENGTPKPLLMPTQ